MESWFFLEHGRCAPSWNMACDQWLLRNAQRIGRPVLRTYGWDRPSVSIGYFQAYPSGMAAPYSVVRRPTGGALVFHDFDLTFTVALPPGHPWRKLGVCERYARVHERVVRVFERRGRKAALAPPCSSSHIAGKTGPHSQSSSLIPEQCFAKNSRYDVVMDGVKIAGGAQRATRDGLIHQGSIQAEREWRVSSQELKAAWETCGAKFEKFILFPEQRSEINELAVNPFGTRWWNQNGGGNRKAE